MRLFLAVSAGERFTAELTTEITAWRSKLSVAWTKPANWHITLQFLGEWPESRVPELIAALGEVTAADPFTMSPGPLDAFPNLESPRVLFLQMRDDGSCARLAGRAREAVERTWPQGPQDRRDFRAHLTVARVKRLLSSIEINLIKDSEFAEFQEIPVEGFSLVRSRLDSRGPSYSEIAFFPLRKKGE